MEADSPVTSDRFPVAVMMETREVSGSRWTTEVVEAVGVVSGALAAESEPREVFNGDGTRRVLWPGFVLELHTDDGLSYYSNLTAENPSVFVVCEDGEDGQLEPTFATVSYGEASAGTETEIQVFAVPMPGDVYNWVERYVVENYVPEEPRKRRRQNWSKDGDGGGAGSGGGRANGALNGAGRPHDGRRDR